MKLFLTNSMMGVALVLSLLSLAACGDKPQPPKLFEPQREALDKARVVEQLAASSVESLKREEEKQSQ